MRFDDSLTTVLSADSSSPFGAQSAFRQIVDLIGRGRVEAAPELIARLEALRSRVPAAARAASARALALTRPPAPLVGFFADDEPNIAAAVLRIAVLDADEWIALLPRLGPAGRAILRRRGDLPEAVTRALESFGSTDFTLGFAGEIPVPEESPAAVAAAQEAAPAAAVSAGAIPHGFDIADLVDRIAAFQRQHSAPEPERAPAPLRRFTFETDANGLVCWTDAVPRVALIGLTLPALTAAARARMRVDDGALTLAHPALAGAWRYAAVPAFDRAGAFIGLRGIAQRSEPAAATLARSEGEAMRRLVHELRTPLNAVSGFAELIDGEMLGAVPPVHRGRAQGIRSEAAALLATLEELDSAARAEA